MPKVLELPVEKLLIDESKNFRFTKHTDASVKDMAKDMTEHGQLQAILIGPEKDGLHPVIFGFRRALAAKKANLPIQCIVCNEDESKHATLNIVENNARKELSYMDKAAIVKRLTEEGKSPKDIAKLLRTTANDVSQLKMLNDLVPGLQDKLHKKIITLDRAIYLCKRAEKVQNNANQKIDEALKKEAIDPEDVNSKTEARRAAKEATNDDVNKEKNIVPKKFIAFLRNALTEENRECMTQPVCETLEAILDFYTGMTTDFETTARLEAAR